MAFVTIDGIRLEVPADKNVLECALENGIYIPHLCHHKETSRAMPYVRCGGRREKRCYLLLYIEGEGRNEYQD